MNAIETLVSVLCDPEGKCCISGSDDDRRLIDSALAELTQAAQEDSVLEDAARYRWLCCKFGETRFPCALENWLEHGHIADGKPSIDAAIDAARKQGARWQSAVRALTLHI